MEAKLNAKSDKICTWSSDVEDSEEKNVGCKSVIESREEQTPDNEEKISADFVCKFCLQRFPTEKRLKSHTFIAHGNKLNRGVKENTPKRKPNGKFKCSHCKKTYAYKQSLDSHVKKIHGVEIHEQNPKLFCEKCGISFHRHHQLLLHVDRVHSDKDKQRECPDCHKMYGPTVFLLHCKSAGHGGYSRKVKLLVCPICGKDILKKNLNSHIKFVHEKQRDFQCSVCPKKFWTKTYLRKHLESHKSTMERHRPHKCDRCGQAYFTVNALQAHKTAVHDGNKIFKCKDCPKVFGYQSSLSKHVQMRHKIDKERNDDMQVEPSPEIQRHHRFQCICGYTNEDADAIVTHTRVCPAQLEFLKNQVLLKTNTEMDTIEIRGVSAENKNENQSAETELDALASPYLCGHCFQGFNDFNEVQEHVVLHTEDSEVAVH